MTENPKDPESETAPHQVPDESAENVEADQGNGGSEEEFDETDYTPPAIRDLLDAPPLLPHEDRSPFVCLFESFEFHVYPKTVPEYWLVWQVTLLTWEVMRYSRMKVSVIGNQHRAAVESLFRKTHEASALIVRER